METNEIRGKQLRKISWGGGEGGGQANWLATPKGESGTAHWHGRGKLGVSHIIIYVKVLFSEKKD